MHPAAAATRQKSAAARQSDTTSRNQAERSYPLKPSTGQKTPATAAYTPSKRLLKAVKADLGATHTCATRTTTKLSLMKWWHPTWPTMPYQRKYTDGSKPTHMTIIIGWQNTTEKNIPSFPSGNRPQHALRLWHSMPKEPFGESQAMIPESFI